MKVSIPTVFVFFTALLLGTSAAPVEVPRPPSKFTTAAKASYHYTKGITYKGAGKVANLLQKGSGDQLHLSGTKSLNKARLTSEMRKLQSTNYKLDQLDELIKNGQSTDPNAQSQIENLKTKAASRNEKVNELTEKHEKLKAEMSKNQKSRNVETSESVKRQGKVPMKPPAVKMSNYYSFQDFLIDYIYYW